MLNKNTLMLMGISFVVGVLSGTKVVIHPSRLARPKYIGNATKESEMVELCVEMMRWASDAIEDPTITYDEFCKKLDEKIDFIQVITQS